MSPQRRVLVAGCGYVGTRLAALLAADGDEVWGLSRRPRGLPEGVTPLAADVTDPELAAALPRRLDAAVYLVAAEGRDEEAYRRAYVEGLAQFLAALEQLETAPRRVLQISSTGVYGESEGGEVDEASPADASHFTGALVAEGEARLRESPLPTSALRFGGIYGPGRERLIETVRAGRRPGPDELWTNRIHRDDGARAIRHLLGVADLASCYCVVDRQPATMGEVVDWIAARCGLPAPPPGEVSPAAERRGRGKRVSSARLVASGFRHTFPSYQEGYESLIGAGEKD
jgi:nucleoside-diphosphate-sugar epimerase